MLNRFRVCILLALTCSPSLFGEDFTMKVTDKYTIDKAHECMQVYKTTDAAHPGVKMVMDQAKYNLAGPVKVLSTGSF